MNLHLDRTNLESTLIPYNNNDNDDNNNKKTIFYKSYYPYGTAGFREYATELHPIMIRIGLAMAVVAHYHSQQQQQQQANHDAATTATDTDTDTDTDTTNNNILLPSLHMGIMITASHNTHDYNGVKCIDNNGGMISSFDESILTTIVNERNIDTLLTYIQELLVVKVVPVVPSDLPTTSTTTTTTTSTTTTYQPPTIHIGYDTRSHSIEFANLVMKGIQLLDSSTTTTTTTTTTTMMMTTTAVAAVATTVASSCTTTNVQNHGIVTTPILHHIVKHYNGFIGYYHSLPSILSTHLNTIGYYHILIQSYVSLLETKSIIELSNTNTTNNNNNNKRILHVDCACGVGYIHLNAIVQQLVPTNTNTTATTTATIPATTSTTTTNNKSIIVIHNPPTTTNQQQLNVKCGSEYVQKQQCSCIWYDENENMNKNDNDTNCNDDDSNNHLPKMEEKSYCASLDGDGDRIVFFSCSNTTTTNTNTNINTKETFLLLDGDYIACLLCTFLQQELQHIETYVHQTTISPNTTIKKVSIPTIRFGVVQTAYANGASTHYLQQQKINVMMAKTGVKYVHAAAHENYDIGIYFESNGHGTVIFNDAYYSYLHAIEQLLYHPPPSPSNTITTTTTTMARPKPEVYCAYQRLKILPSLINQAVGDAISDLLLIDAILYIKDWTLQDWYESFYTNLPSRQMKVQVLDRNIIQTNENETQCLVPSTVQPALNQLMEQYASVQARVFIRPSGTEDVVRVYAEATTQDIADQLAQRAIIIVQELCGGICNSEPSTH